MTETNGYLCLVLHAHLPFVRHPESENMLEERWLFEAMTDTYIPLLQVFQALLQDGVDFRITMSLSPPLVSMLTDPLLQKRYRRHLITLIALAKQEVARTADTPEIQVVARHYYDRFIGIRNFYLKYKGNLISAFREVQAKGCLEIITSAATHAFLPLLATEEGIRAQIKTAVALHEEYFGVRPRGIWLPECGYRPGLDQILKEEGLAYFVADSHGVGLAVPPPVFGLLSPILTPQGVAVFPRDEASSKQVWSADGGYPGDFDYREYYRDIGYDLDLEIIKPYIHPDGIRINTGIKYYRITGKGEHKEPYQLEWAKMKAARHAEHFLDHRRQQVKWGYKDTGRMPIIVAPYDAELFGHWWYEGPMWLDEVFRQIKLGSNVLKPITPSEYLYLYSEFQVCGLPMSSWGRGGYSDVWLEGENDWIYPVLHVAELQMIQLARRFPKPTPLVRRVLNQAARELMLAQSSDWAFIMDAKTMVDYAVKRVKHHWNRFKKLQQMIDTETINESWLEQLEQLDPIFPKIDYQVYAGNVFGKRKDRRPTVSPLKSKQPRPRVLMLSWEFPPMTVGGLSRHVYDLSRFLVRQGWDVHVITTEIGEYPEDERVEGVEVHRVRVMKPDGGEFIHWAFQLNLMMIERCKKLLASDLRFDLIHAHDWLVAQAAITLKKETKLPLVATIHATEHGRNQGIYSDLQREIHQLEWKLTDEAQRVILCSAYMQEEVERIFQIPIKKCAVIPNGVDPELLRVSREEGKRQAEKSTITPYALPHERIVFFVGRLVREKGVHTLLEAAPDILASFPDVKFVIAGKGPALEDLIHRADLFGIREKTNFTGFITDEERNRLYRLAEVAVFPSLYEPFGIVALEGMATHTPVIVSDVGGLADVISHGKNGLKMHPGNPTSLATQVKALLGNREFAMTLADNALRQLWKYDWNQIAGQTMSIYRKAMLSSNPVPVNAQKEGLV